MGFPAPTDDRGSSSVFHVGDHRLAPGQALRPYAIARDCARVLGLADHALDGGADAVRRLLAGDACEHSSGGDGCRLEMVLLEAIFDRVRLRDAPGSPGRLDAVFAWPSLALARRFRDGYRPRGIIYRCAVAGTAAERDAGLVVEAYEVADLRHPAARDLRRVADRARRYWQARRPMALPELLVHGVVVVEAIVELGADQRVD